MPEDLAITDVVLSGRRRSLPSPMFGHREIWFDVTITVENRGDDPLHVVRELRGTSYDAEERRLTLFLREQKPRPLKGEPPAYTLPPPATITVKPGSTASISVPIPAVRSEMQLRSGAPPAFEDVDIRAMRRLRVELSASTRLLGEHAGHDAHALRTRVAKWGKTITHETAVKPDTRD